MMQPHSHAERQSSFCHFYSLISKNKHLMPISILYRSFKQEVERMTPDIRIFCWIPRLSASFSAGLIPSRLL